MTNPSQQSRFDLSKSTSCLYPLIYLGSCTAQLPIRLVVSLHILLFAT